MITLRVEKIKTMGNNLYTTLWEKYRPVINTRIKEGGGTYQLAAQDFERHGDRKSSGYSFTLSITDGEIPELAGNAVARDLKTVLDGSKTFKAQAADKHIVIRLTSSFELQIRVTPQS